MRWTFAACAAVCAVLAAGCQNNDAQLREEIAQLKARQSETRVDPVVAALLASKGEGSEALDRKLNTLSEDLRASMSRLREEIAAGAAEQKSRMGEVDRGLAKVTALESSITALRGTIDALESKMRVGNPEEVLKLTKDLLAKEAALEAELRARQAAEARLAELEGRLKTATDQLEEVKSQVTALETSDAAKQVARLRAENGELRTENANLKSDLTRTEAQRAEIEKEIRRLRGDAPKPAIERAKYDFSSLVAKVSMPSRPGGPSIVMVDIGDNVVIPPVGAEMTVLNARGEVVCRIRVEKHYHGSDNTSLPIEELGCFSIDEKATNPITKGDTVVWIRPADATAPASEPPKPEPEKSGTAGGN